MRYLALVAGVLAGLFMPAAAFAKMLEQEQEPEPPSRSARPSHPGKLIVSG